MPIQKVTIELTPEQQTQIKLATGKSVTTLTFTAEGASEQDGIVMEF